MTSRGTKYWNSGAIPLIAPDILGDIIAQVADVGVVISENGTILSVLVNPSNDAFRELERWEGRNIRAVLAIESVAKFEQRLGEFLQAKGFIRPVELNHIDESGKWSSPVRYSFHRIGPDGAILLLGRDLRPIAEMQQQLVEAQLSLERDYETQREYDTRFRVLMDSTTEAVLFVSVQSGEIIEANGAATVLLDRAVENLVGTQFSDCFEGRKRGDIVEGLATQAISDLHKKTTANLRGNGMMVDVFPTLFRAAGERILLCRLVPIDASKAKSDDLGKNLQGLYLDGPEAIVFASESGDVLSANDAFLDLIDAAHDVNVRGRSLSDYLQRGSVDFKVMTENAIRAGRMRNYATKLNGSYGNPRSVDVSVTKLSAGTQNIFAFVLRDANRAEATQSRPHPTSDESMRSVAELVGSATLKDIVAETTNVVEKMCIETAVELTMNNRVAAAEMLGLSRQSLYVKLRKFGLLSREIDGEE
ncbi:MAG: transcriptional regulator PpsR [Yoonia sp.]|uniref:transcriptional regulator PpsR n=1 Tax=Yoonia sp. TaxID=2212373 RepID=UPI00273E7EFA|nr:transcriptional regulator PpsR [Yoonia sp.]MDP5086673.1 transcriptional regulator PpsR [Yoonia sp.]